MKVNNERSISWRIYIAIYIYIYNRWRVYSNFTLNMFFMRVLWKVGYYSDVSDSECNTDNEFNS